MLPQNVVSDPAVTAAFLFPDIDDLGEMISLELGGVGLNDPSQGRMVQVWTARIDGQAVKVSAPNTPETTLFTVAGTLTAVSLAFDSNMQPAVSFTEDGMVKLRWFDTTLPGFTTTTFAGATRSEEHT